MRLPSPFPDIAPELLTGHPEIDNEHRLLLRAIEQLRGICCKFDSVEDCRGCPHATAKGCDNYLVETLGDLLMFLVDHFRNEEDLMKIGRVTLIDREICERHKEDHAAISHAVQDIIAALAPLKTAQHIRTLHKLLENWVSNHIQVHDMVLVRMLSPFPEHFARAR